MYRTAVLIVFLGVVAIVAVDLAVRVMRRQPTSGKRPPVTPIGYLRILVNAVGFLGLLGAASTGFSALLTSNNEMTGDRLIWHVTFAPVFALTAVAVTFFWAHKNRFAAADQWPVTLRKFFFWCAVALSVPAMVSILAAMFPLFGTDDQQELFRIHRYCAPLLTGAGLLFAYFALVTRRERSKE